MRACNPSNLEAEAGGLQTQTEPAETTEQLKAILGNSVRARLTVESGAC